MKANKIVTHRACTNCRQDRRIASVYCPYCGAQWTPSLRRLRVISAKAERVAA